MNTRIFRVDLRRLILCLCLLSVVWALVSTLYASYLVQRNILLSHSQEVNRVYASKLASTTEALLEDMGRRLAYSAKQLSRMEQHPELIDQETLRQKEQSNHFNAVLVVSNKGRILDIEPPNPSVPRGHIIQSDATNQPLTVQKPLLSVVFQSRSTKDWIILYSYPIFSPDNRYLGYIGGTLRLHAENVLDTLLGSHEYRDGSELYVFSQEGVLLFHPNRELIGTTLADKPVLQAVQRRGSGTLRFREENGAEMLASYAVVPRTGWTIVAKRPTAATLSTLSALLLDTVVHTMPLLLVALLSIWWLSKLIAQPLRQLASLAHNMEELQSSEGIRKVKSWYFEAAQLKRALLTGLSSIHDKMRDLHRESTTDPLSGLLNRRGLARALEVIQQSNVPVAVISIDIDHFKMINDQHGHGVGDVVIRLLAKLMQENSRSGDALARSGGEEFVILLPNTSTDQAIGVASRLRRAMAQATSTTESPATISLGVARYPDHGAHVEAVMLRADRALYYAKNNGRNAICVAENNAANGLCLLRPKH